MGVGGQAARPPGAKYINDTAPLLQRSVGQSKTKPRTNSRGEELEPTSRKKKMQKHNTKEEEIRAITQSIYRSVQTWNEHIHVCIQKTYG